MDNIIEERFYSKFEEIESYLKDLSEITQEDPDLNQKNNYHATSMLLFSIVNATIDIADNLKFWKKLGKTSTYYEIFEAIYNNNLINKDLFEELTFLISQRNILAHEYGQFSKKDLINIRNKVYCIYDFVEIAKKILKNNL